MGESGSPTGFFTYEDTWEVQEPGLVSPTVWPSLGPRPPDRRRDLAGEDQCQGSAPRSGDVPQARP